MSAEDLAAVALAHLQGNGSCGPTVVEAFDNEIKKEERSKPPTKRNPSNPNAVTLPGDAAPTLKPPGKPTSGKRKRGKEEHVFPLDPHVIQVVKKPRTFTNHSYRDFSKVPDTNEQEDPKEIFEMTFPRKVHHILSQEEYKSIISWMPHGRAFRVLVPKAFERSICKKYFGHSRYSSFLRQLSNFGFKHLTQGRDRNCYYHEFMLRGLPHLCHYMPKPKDARRLIPDPENEPDFYLISKAFPLPDDPDFGKDDVPQSKPAATAEPVPAIVGMGSFPASTTPSAIGQPVRPGIVRAGSERAILEGQISASQRLQTLQAAATPQLISTLATPAASLGPARVTATSVVPSALTSSLAGWPDMSHAVAAQAAIDRQNSSVLAALRAQLVRANPILGPSSADLSILEQIERMNQIDQLNRFRGF